MRLAASGHSGLARVQYGDLYPTDGGGLEPDAPLLTSTICRQADFGRASFRYWMEQLGHPPVFHRKVWEYFFIAHALHERGLLTSGMKGLGFAVGQEPLVALFARLGCTIVASDMASDAARASGWVDSEQFAGGVDVLNSLGICPADVFASSVSYQTVDMTRVPEHLTGFDFCWSACAFEHLGSLVKGLAFVKRSLDTVRPGGIAIHTTEFNLSSNDETLEAENISLYRRQDIDGLSAELTEAGHQVAPLDWHDADGLVDGFVDLPPYAGEPHLRLRVEGYDSTSIGLIVRRGEGRS